MSFLLQTASKIEHLKRKRKLSGKPELTDLGQGQKFVKSTRPLRGFQNVNHESEIATPAHR